MTTFLIGLAILLVGGAIYGRIIEKHFGPTDKPTPAYTSADGVDYVPMSRRRNNLLHLLNIAGTGPILGPIQGILFGPLAFITIPLGCILAGAVHDYMVGMISVRHNGRQINGLVKGYLGKRPGRFFTCFVSIALLLFAATCIYTPGDIFVHSILKKAPDPNSPMVWIVYACIFLYYAVATIFPIDKVIGKLYPYLGAFFILSSVILFFAIFYFRMPLDNLTWKSLQETKAGFFPFFFVTVACGIASGFHATQATIVSRTIKRERDGRSVFYNMMVAEGFIAMTWAAVTMGASKIFGLDNSQPASIELARIISSILEHFGDDSMNPVLQIVPIIRNFLGNGLDVLVILGVIALPITSGDTALRSLRLVIGETFGIDQSKISSRLATSLGLFLIVIGLLILSKASSSGFLLLWRYFAWANQIIVVFSCAMATAWCISNGKSIWFTLLPGTFYLGVVSSYIVISKIGFNASASIGYLAGGICMAAYMAFFIGWEHRVEAKTIKRILK